MLSNRRDIATTGDLLSNQNAAPSIFTLGNGSTTTYRIPAPVRTAGTRWAAWVLAAKRRISSFSAGMPFSLKADTGQAFASCLALASHAFSELFSDDSLIVRLNDVPNGSSEE